MPVALILSALLLAPADSDWITRWVDDTEKGWANGYPKDPSKLLEFLAKLETEAKDQKDVEGEVYAQWRRGGCEFRLGLFTRATRTLETAIRRMATEVRYRDTSGQEQPAGHFFLFMLHVDLGEFFLRLGRFEKAEDNFTKALAMVSRQRALPLRGKTKTVETTAIARLNILLAQCLIHRDEFQRARRKLQVVERQIPIGKEETQGNDRLTEEWAFIQIECKTTLADLDRLEEKSNEAIQHLRSCLSDLKLLDSPRSLYLRFDSHLQLARLYSKITRFEDAEVQLDRAHNIHLKIKTEHNEAVLRSNRATLGIDRLLFRFDPAGGKVMLEELATVEHLVKDALDAPKPTANLTAFKKFELAQVHEFRGRTYDYQRERGKARAEYDTACRHYDEAVKLLEAIPFPPDHDMVLQVRRCRERLRIRRGIPEELPAVRREAARLLNLNIRKHQKKSARGKGVDLGDFYHLVMESEVALGNLPEAAQHATSLRKLYAEQLVSYLPSLTAAEQIGFFRGWDAPGLHASLCLAAHAKATEKIRAASAEWLLNGKAKVADVFAQVNRQARLGKAYPEFQRSLQRQASFLYGGSLEGKALRDQLLAEEGKRRLLSERTVGLETPWFSLAQIRAKLTKDEIYLDIFCLRPGESAAGPTVPRYVAWVTSKIGPVRIIDLGEAKIIDGAIEKLRQALKEAPKIIQSKGEPKAVEALREPLRKLSDLVLKPLMPHMGKAKNWFISPDANLWLVPWQMLLLADGKHAVEKHRISYLSSGRELVARTPAKVTPTRALVLADPDFDLHDESLTTPRSLPGFMKFGSVRRLPGSAMEARAITPALKAYTKQAPRVLVGRNAIKSAFHSTKHPRVLVLSTHGFFLGEQPAKHNDKQVRVENPLLRCGLLLAGCNQGGSQSVLTGLEVLGADLRGCELVVLSACETGLGDVQSGEGVAGLRQAFRMAGAEAVISSLWPVSDKQSAHLMRLFFANLSRGQSKAEALREAQIKLIEERREDFAAAHPFFWAAFTLTGS